MNEKALKSVMISAGLVLFALISMLLLANKMTRPETYAATIASIDEKTDTVLKLTAASTLASAGVSAIPGDTATPIAEKLADFTEYFLLVMCVLYTEKYLLTIIGAGVFRILIPVACGLGIICCFKNSQMLRRLAIKLAVIGLCLVVTVPLSLKVSDMIYDTYRVSLTETVDSAQKLSEDTTDLAEAEDDSVLQSVLGRLSESVTSLSNRASNLLNRFVESLAVMIVTTCLIPLLVLLFFIWLIKALTGIKVPFPVPKHRLRGKKEQNDDEEHLTTV